MQLPQLLPLIVLPLAITTSPLSPPPSVDISSHQASNSTSVIRPSPISYSEQGSNPSGATIYTSLPRNQSGNSPTNRPPPIPQPNTTASNSSISSKNNDPAKDHSNNKVTSEDSEVDKKGSSSRGGSRSCTFSCISDGAGAATPMELVLVGGLVAGGVLL